MSSVTIKPRINLRTTRETTLSTLIFNLALITVGSNKGGRKEWLQFLIEAARPQSCLTSGMTQDREITFVTCRALPEIASRPWNMQSLAGWYCSVNGKLGKSLIRSSYDSQSDVTRTAGCSAKGWILEIIDSVLCVRRPGRRVARKPNELIVSDWLQPLIAL